MKPRCHAFLTLTVTVILLAIVGSFYAKDFINCPFVKKSNFAVYSKDNVEFKADPIFFYFNFDTSATEAPETTTTTEVPVTTTEAPLDDEDEETTLRMLTGEEEVTTTVAPEETTEETTVAPVTPPVDPKPKLVTTLREIFPNPKVGRFAHEVRTLLCESPTLSADNCQPATIAMATTYGAPVMWLCAIFAMLGATTSLFRAAKEKLDADLIAAHFKKARTCMYSAFFFHLLALGCREVGLWYYTVQTPALSLLLGQVSLLDHALALGVVGKAHVALMLICLPWGMVYGCSANWYIKMARKLEGQALHDEEIYDELFDQNKIRKSMIKPRLTVNDAPYSGRPSTVVAELGGMRHSMARQSVAASQRQSVRVLPRRSSVAQPLIAINEATGQIQAPRRSSVFVRQAPARVLQGFLDKNQRNHRLAGVAIDDEVEDAFERATKAPPPAFVFQQPQPLQVRTVNGTPLFPTTVQRAGGLMPANQALRANAAVQQRLVNAGYQQPALQPVYQYAAAPQMQQQQPQVVVLQQQPQPQPQVILVQQPQQVVRVPAQQLVMQNYQTPYAKPF